MNPETTANLVLMVAMIIATVLVIVLFVMGGKSFNRALFAKNKPTQTRRLDTAFTLIMVAFLGIMMTMISVAYPQVSSPFSVLWLAALAAGLWSISITKRRKQKDATAAEILAADELPEGVEPAELLTHEDFQDVSEAIGRQPRVAVVQKPGEF